MEAVVAAVRDQLLSVRVHVLFGPTIRLIDLLLQLQVSGSIVVACFLGDLSGCLAIRVGPAVGTIQPFM